MGSLQLERRTRVISSVPIGGESEVHERPFLQGLRPGYELLGNREEEIVSYRDIQQKQDEEKQLQGMRIFLLSLCSTVLLMLTLI